MDTPLLRRLFSPGICQSCRQHTRPLNLARRAFTTTSHRRADGLPPPSNPQPPPKSSNYAPNPTPSLFQPRSDSHGTPPPSPQAASLSLTERFAFKKVTSQSASSPPPAPFDIDSLPGFNAPSLIDNHLTRDEPFVLHVYSHRHNTHLTLSGPFPARAARADDDQRKPLSLSAGNIGFRKAQRGTFDAAFQLAAFVMKAVGERGMLPLIERSGLEVRYRGFGKGREAVTKALLGNEGKMLRERIVRVSDATRLKFGGTRSPKPRRLG